jgi:hypothetical protein
MIANGGARNTPSLPAEDLARQFLQFLEIEAQNDPAAANHHGTANQVGLGGHQTQGFRPSRRLLAHLLLAEEFVARIQEFPVIAVADQLIELLKGQAVLADIPQIEIGALGFEQTASLAATRSSRLVQEPYLRLALARVL